MCGKNFSEEDEPTNLDLNVIDYDYFNQIIKPILIDRIPSFKGMELVDAFAGYYEFNTLDQNLIIGHHPVLNNLIFANGSSGHGFQHAAAIGRAVAELIVYQRYSTIDLKRFGFERVIRNDPIKEIDVV
jgi:FAD-dependent oxidoreductase domain-containing protein 1